VGWVGALSGASVREREREGERGRARRASLAVTHRGLERHRGTHCVVETYIARGVEKKEREACVRGAAGEGRSEGGEAKSRTQTGGGKREREAHTCPGHVCLTSCGGGGGGGGRPEVYSTMPLLCPSARPARLSRSLSLRLWLRLRAQTHTCAWPRGERQWTAGWTDGDRAAERRWAVGAAWGG
jgi:hypothetical protein